MLLSWRMGPSQLDVGSFAPVQAAAALHLHMLRECLLQPLLGHSRAMMPRYTC